MPVYAGDNLEYFKKATSSILNQTLKPDEIVIVVDGPIPNTHKLFLNELSENSIINVIFNAKNCGSGVSRDIGIKNCKNEIIALMDSDDISVPNRFEKQLNYLVNNNVDIIGGWIEEFTEIPGDINSIRKVPSSHNEIYEYGKWRMPVNNVTLMFKKKAYFEVGGYPKQRRVEDWSLIAKMILNNNIFYNFPEILVYARAGKKYFSRRRKFNHFFYDLKIFLFMYKRGYINFLIMMINIIIRIVLKVLPQFITRIIYNNILREKN